MEVGGGRQRHGGESHTCSQGTSESQGTPPLRPLSWSLTSQGGPSLVTFIPSCLSCCPTQGQACMRHPGAWTPSLRVWNFRPRSQLQLDEAHKEFTQDHLIAQTPLGSKSIRTRIPLQMGVRLPQTPTPITALHLEMTRKSTSLHLDWIPQGICFLGHPLPPWV